jgi:S-formylglutathione hydrolase
MMSVEVLSDVRCFDGRQLQVKHASRTCGCDMVFSLFLPPAAETGSVPVLVWLSGLTCTDQNFVTKAGAQRTAAERGLALVAPDTSPRGEGVPDDPDGAYDFGLGAGFYVDATQAPWSRHYRMESYVTQELPAVLAEWGALDQARTGIFGHSMGGHGALTLALRHPEQYRSVSAFAPICAPSECPWGQKALGGYLGPDTADWAAHDACALIRAHGYNRPIRVDQGLADGFLEEQLQPEKLEAACAEAGVALTLNRREGYDHSYFFIATFMEAHLRFHAEALRD